MLSYRDALGIFGGQHWFVTRSPRYRTRRRCRTRPGGSARIPSDSLFKKDVVSLTQSGKILTVHPACLTADALAIALAVGLPLYFPNGYVGLVGDKFGLLLACLIVAAVALAGSMVWGRKSLPEIHPDPAWLWPVGLCAVYGLAWFFAEDRYTALWGLEGRKNGWALYLACTAVYLIVAAFGSARLLPMLTGALTVTGGVITVLCWMNYFLFDPLDAYYVFLPENGELFLGTIGNINFYGALLCLCLPLAAESYLRRGRMLDGRYFIALLLFSGLIVAGSDAAWLGCAAAFAAMLCRKKTTTHTVGRFLLLLAGLGVCCLLVWLLLLLLPARSALRTVSAWICSPLPAVGMLVVCVPAARWLLRRPEQRAYPVTRGLTAAALVLAAAAVAAANLLPTCPAVLEPLHFTERWAANRGYAWQRLWTVYTEDTTLLQKLIGLGGDAANARLNPDLPSTLYMELLNGEAFDSAHNELLQHLVCGGLLGLVCWCGFFMTALVRGFRRHPAVGAALLGYLVQSLFSISMPGVFPLVFVLAALTGKAGRSKKDPGAGIRLCAAGSLTFLALLVLMFWPQLA